MTDEAPKPPVLRTVAQFARSVHFTNDAASNGTAVSESPKIEFKIDIKDKPRGDNRYEVVLEMSVEANSGEDAVFTVEIEYVGLFEVTGVPEDKLPLVLRVECPRLLFPFVRRQIADVTREGGFMPLLLDPIDFLSLYLKQKKAAEAAQSQARH